MRFTAVLAFVAAVTVVSAETNSQRLARGLSPKAPAKRGATPVYHASRGAPSGSPGGCNTGSVQCCGSVQQSGSSDEVDSLLGILGVVAPLGTSVGLNCSPISVLGGTCSSQTVCCEQNHWNGLVNLDCNNISL